MLKIDNFEVLGWEHAIRGMRNPMNSWEKSDSECLFHMFPNYSGNNPKAVEYERYLDEFNLNLKIGPNDQKLMMSLRNAGTDHRKFMRMITVYLDITAPLYWWKEFDTYKVGTVANSCSTMHKIHAKKFEFEDFSYDHLLSMEDHYDEWAIPLVDVSPYRDKTIVFSPVGILSNTINMLNCCRDRYLQAKKGPMKDESKRPELMKKYWWQMIQLLPSSYNQKRTVMLNYEVLANIYKSRRHHKLDEWHVLCDWIEKLPYSELITGVKEENQSCLEERRLIWTVMLFPKRRLISIRSILILNLSSRVYMRRIMNWSITCTLFRITCMNLNTKKRVLNESLRRLNLSWNIPITDLLLVRRVLNVNLRHILLRGPAGLSDAEKICCAEISSQ